MVEGDLLEGHLSTLVLREKVPPHDGVLELASIRGCRDVREDDGLLYRRDLLLEPRDDVRPVVVLATVAVAVDGEKHLWLYLLHPVDDAACAEVGGATRPHRAYRGAGEQGDHGFRDVGKVGRDPVTAFYAHRSEAGGERGGPITQLTPAHLAQGSYLGLVHDRGFVLVVLGVLQDVPGVVQLGSCKPLGPRHLTVSEYPLVGFGEFDAAVLPHRGPEVLHVGDGPFPEPAIVVEREALLPLQPGHVLGDLRVLLEVLRRL